MIKDLKIKINLMFLLYIEQNKSHFIVLESCFEYSIN